MSKPKIADRKPIKATLQKGEEQYWCACGLSNNQPYCDGSHRTTDITPKKFIAEETGDAYLCMCKHSKNPPYCDGTHATLKEEEQETTVNNSPTPGSTKEEPTLSYIKALAKDGLTKVGHHGEMGAMGVPIPELPQWKDIQILAAQMTIKPLMEDVEIKNEKYVGEFSKFDVLYK